MNISGLLEQNARKYGGHEAIVDGTQRISYKELDFQVNRLSFSLMENGFKKGDRAIIFMPNTASFIIAYFACIRAGGIVVPLNAKLTKREFEEILQHSGAAAVFSHETLWHGIKDVNSADLRLKIKTGQHAEGWSSIEDLTSGDVNRDVFCSLKEDDDAALLYTSGTTGKPKGVLLTHRNVLNAAMMMCLEVSFKPESRILHMMPLSHSAPLNLFLAAGTLVGAAHIVCPAFHPEEFLHLVENEKITHFFGAPIAYLLAAKSQSILNCNLSSIQYWVYGGAPLSRKEVEYLKGQFRTENFVCVYGLTEAGPSGTLLTAEEHRSKPGSIGRRAAFGTEIRLVDENGFDVREGEIGEIVLSGESIMKGYFTEEEKTKDIIRNGWLLTGDLARRDQDGYYWIVDRKKDMIITGGVNVYPKEIEDLLVQHPDISEAAIVGVPHPEWGETVKAFIVTKKPIKDLEEECKRFLSDELAAYKIPKLYEAIDQLPRNAAGKILKQQLKKGNITIVQ
ncbi:class I adenylate-forming enzyme family protein [Heyndrickxia acidicola]|uniref:AMP-binding protein n=1 Tax=Heyndrickxia acidicola TaxID=209389 RepID=A0ABU6MC74_9BACI|nr:AMP-binding protein [Heyndrickxia acidicola]MED1202268.1 AMP-binding protein [Heyndrickxia acidicola]